MAIIKAINHYLPNQFRTSDEIETLLRQNNPHIQFLPGLIEKITGIQTRPLANVDEFSSTFAINAANKLFQESQIDPSSIDLLIFAAATQDLIEPATSHIVQATLGTKANCFDLKNACNSFLNGLEVASSLLQTQNYQRALLVVGEKPSVSLKIQLQDRQDFKNSFAGTTFGDSGVAILLEKSETKSGIIFQKFISLSKFWNAGTLPGGGTRHPRGDEFSYFQGGGMALKEAFMELGPSFLNQCLQELKLDYVDFARIFIHQVSKSFLDEFISIAQIPATKVAITIQKYGNLAASTLPLSLSLALESGEVKKGDKVLMIGLAGGISLGVVAIEV